MLFIITSKVSEERVELFLSESLHTKVQSCFLLRSCFFFSIWYSYPCGLPFLTCLFKLVIDKNKASVRFGLMHLLATNIAVWFVTAITETAEDYKQQAYLTSVAGKNYCSENVPSLNRWNPKLDPSTPSPTPYRHSKIRWASEILREWRI